MSLFDDSKFTEKLITHWENELIKFSPSIRGRFFLAMIVNEKTKNIISCGINSVFINFNPLHHAEITALNNAFKNKYHNIQLPDYFVMISSHEPCMMCASAIMWSGIKKTYYVFSYEETSEMFDMPIDIDQINETCNINHLKLSKKIYDYKQINNEKFKNDLMYLYKKYYR